MTRPRTRIGRLFSRLAPARRAARFRPAPEALEERIAMATFVLSTLADDGSPGSLRAAIVQSNLTPEADTISIPHTIFPSIFGEPVIRLNGSPLPTVTGTTSIIADSAFGNFGATVLKISGDFKSRVFQVGGTGNLSLTNLLVVDGSTTGDGGAILNQGVLSLERVTVSGNSATNGGGIANTGPSLTVVDSTITNNIARARGGGVLTSGTIAMFIRSNITSNTVRGVDNLTVSTAVTPIANSGGTAEGGGLAILNGVVVIDSSTISDNMAIGGKGGPSGDGTDGSDFANPAASSAHGQPGARGGDAQAAGPGGVAFGGGIWIERGLLGVQSSTLSGNRAIGGAGGDGGRGGKGGAGQDGGDAEDRFGFLTSGGRGGVGGQGGAGGAGGGGGAAYGGGLYVDFDPGSISFVNSTIAANQAIGGQGGRSGAGGAGGAGGRGGQGNTLNASGSGGNGGDGGNGGTTGVTGTAHGGGVYYSPSTSGRTLNSTTVAYNDASAGAAGAAGAGGAAGLGGASPFGPGKQGANGRPGVGGATGAAGGAFGGGLIHVDAAFGTENFRLSLRNTIVAANTVTSTQASDIVGTLRTPADSVANLIGTGGSGGLIHGVSGNKVGVGSPGLRPLGNYGGPTKTVGLTSASPAVDAGDNGVASGSGLTTDQRGAGFARISRGRIDIGAIELQESYIVTTLHDEYDGDTDPGNGQGTSLREAIILANESGTPQTITFAPGLTGTLVLTLGQIGIDGSVTINGPGAAALTIDAGGQNRAFQILGIWYRGDIDVTLRGLTITGGNAFRESGEWGGAISNYEKLTIDSVFIHNNTAFHGGGIYSAGPLTVINSTIANNTVLGYGGGLYLSTADLTAVNSTIAANQAQWNGGGIFSRHVLPTQTVLINVTLASNQAPNGTGFAGDLATGNAYPLTLQNTIFSGTTHGNVGITQFGGNLVGGDAKLSPLAYNGGQVPTMALQAGSPAIDAGVNDYARNAAGTLLIFDQRGLGRVSGPAVDLGAFESQRIDISPASLANGNVGFAYNQQITALQPDSQPWWGALYAGQLLWDQIFLSVMAGTLPAGLTLSSDGVLSGTPSETGTFTFTVAASNLPGTGSRQYTLNISPRPEPVVDTLDDTFDLDYSPGRISLREAIDLVNQGIATGPVRFAPGLSGTITLGMGPLSIVGNMVIQGPGASSIVIDAGGHSRVFDVQGRIGTEAQISGLTVTGGSANVGGGIFNGTAKLSLDGVVITGNSGGGIYSTAAQLFVANSTVAANSGIGIQVVNGSTTVLGSTIAYNTGGAFGGGISMLSGGIMTIINSTIAGNSASRGGGLYIQGANSGPFVGSLGDVTLRNVTVAANSATLGAGAYVDSYSGLFLGNTIIADNNGPQVSIATFQAGVILEGPNLIEGGLDGDPDVLSADPKLGPLQDNGGPTMTMALLSGSPAINAGDADLIPEGILFDQRGAGFARIAGGFVDLGAFEVRNDGPTITQVLDAVVVDEGWLAVNVGHYSDAQGLGTVTLSASLGIVNGDEFTGVWVWTYTAPDGPSGPTTVTITATDNEGLTATTSFTLTVNNVAPTITISGAATVNAGDSYALTLGDVTDPGSDTVTHYIVHWGDGTSDTYSAAGIVTHVYIEGGVTRAITVDLVDEDGTHLNRANNLSVTINASPTLEVPAAQTAYEDVDQPISGIRVAGSNGDILTVSLAVSHGTLRLVPTDGLMVARNGTSSMTISGSIADLNSALARLVYRGNLNFSGADTLTIACYNSSFSTTGTVAITVKSAAEQAADIQNYVRGLRAARKLSSGQENALIVKLDLKGNFSDISKVQNFLRQVTVFFDAGILSQTDADELLRLGNILLLSVTRR